MLAALALAAMTVADVERAFAAAAQTQGQWTAFRALAAPDAVMFVPDPTPAPDWLKGRADPPNAVMWWPSRVYLSCDGALAASTGPWVRKGGGASGYYTTIWEKQADGGWRWLLDHGDALAKPRPAADPVIERRAACDGKPATGSALPHPPSQGFSADGTLWWHWTSEPGHRTLGVELWNGHGFDSVIADDVRE